MIRRSDDNEETLKKRLSAYHSQTEPLISYYTSTSGGGILSPIDATASPSQVLSELQGIILKENEEGK